MQKQIAVKPNTLRYWNKFMRATFKDLIASSLLAVVSETTINQQSKLEGTKIDRRNNAKYTAQEVANIRNLLMELGWEQEDVDKQMQISSLLHRAPELMEGVGKSSTLIYDPFTCIVLLDNTTGHGYPINKPSILTHGAKKHLFAENGKIDQWAYETPEHVANPNKPTHRLATQQEIQECIQQLSDAQWKSLRTLDLFQPIVNQALDTEVQLPSLNSTPSISLEDTTKVN